MARAEGGYAVRVLICGGRSYQDEAPIRAALAALPADARIIHGGCRKGADSIADAAARQLALSVTVFPANWGKYGRAAGPIRNRQMLDEGQPDKVIAFWDGVSHGTGDMVRRAMSAGVPVEIIYQRGCESSLAPKDVAALSPREGETHHGSEKEHEEGETHREVRETRRAEDGEAQDREEVTATAAGAFGSPRAVRGGGG